MSLIRSRNAQNIMSIITQKQTTTDIDVRISKDIKTVIVNSIQYVKKLSGNMKGIKRFQ